MFIRSAADLILLILLADPESRLDSDFERDELLLDDESLSVLCTGLLVIDKLRANFSSALNASHGVT